MWMNVQKFSHSHIFVNVHFITCCFKIDHFVLANNFLCVFASFIYFLTPKVCVISNVNILNYAQQKYELLIHNFFVYQHLFEHTYFWKQLCNSLLYSVLSLFYMRKKVSLILCTKHTHAQHIHNLFGSQIKR